MRAELQLSRREARTTRSPSFANQVRGVLAIAAKDLLCELRARHALGSLGLFAVTITVAVSHVLSAWGAEGDVAAALLWIVVYFSAMSGLGRSFAREQESGSADLLRLTAAPSVVFLGKLFFNFGVTLALLVVLVPVFVLLMGCRIADWGAFLAVLIMGSIGLSIGCTAASALVARAASRGTLFAVIGFPVMLPVLALAISGTQAAMTGTAVQQILASLRLLSYYAVIILTASLALFGFVWEE